MKHNIQIQPKEPVIYLSDDYVYGYRRQWNETSSPLYLSLVHPRSNDKKIKKLPVILWLCGGGWMEMDRKVWLPEMTWFAKRGYAIASIDYSVTYMSRWPRPIQEIKQAVRWLRAHAEELNLDPDHIAVVGESAGGHLAGVAGLVNDDRYDNGEFLGEYLDHSSAIQAAVLFYPPLSLMALMPHLEQLGFNRNMAPADIESWDDLLNLVGPDMPPFLILHGTNDMNVPLIHGEKLYDALEKAGNDVEMYILEDAVHADDRFFQPEVKEIIHNFLNEKFC